MVEISSVLDEYVSDKVKVVLKKNSSRKDDLEFNLCITVEDVNKLSYEQAKIMSMKTEDLNEDLLTAQNVIVQNIL